MTNAIGWCDLTWNPIVGCHPVSSGCHRCYAARMATRLAGNPKTPWYRGIAEGGHWTGKTATAPAPFRSPRNPSRVFVGSMTDLFYGQGADVLFEIILDAVRHYPKHTFMLLTKRPKRMAAFFSGSTMPHNLWLGVSAEDQATADERIPILLGIKAAARFVSIEPQLGPVDLGEYMGDDCGHESNGPAGWVNDPGLDWVIAGPETGPGARPCDPSWIDSLANQCEHMGVPFYDKRDGKPKAWPT